MQTKLTWMYADKDREVFVAQIGDKYYLVDQTVEKTIKIGPYDTARDAWEDNINHCGTRAESWDDIPTDEDVAFWGDGIPVRKDEQ